MEPRDRLKKGYNLGEIQTCFVISPIGKEGTKVYEKFKNTLEYVIKPAIKNSGYDIEVIRADDVDRAGSFIKDILELLLNSFLVIADLTDQNPNVFYELGVRHALSPRTILMAQDETYIPSDLKEYRTIIYEDSAKGFAIVQQKLKNYLEEIYNQPDRNDNPVLDRLGSLLKKRSENYEREIRKLNEKLKEKKKVPSPQVDKNEHVITRTGRIFKIRNVEEPIDSEIFFEDEDGEDVSIEMPTEEGKFEFCYILSKDKDEIVEYWYIARENENPKIQCLLADIRVLLVSVPKLLELENDAVIKFIIATNDELDRQKEKIFSDFSIMKQKANLGQAQNIIIEIWDNGGLTKIEKELGIYV